ncbi:phage tail tip lysozyme [Luteibacter aegosomaticola]|uniref:phage tail tip lysozyme n=1 Tax=Luteibacter aegosomaticola TaxID=2911538 RepID=UPI001FF86407|nr:phage tail tip lysozyme [Luteibacter aegosomaticola]UPG89266.1 phage tail tip lysozyme [Luteibacter aegosomaticola]
MPNFNIVISATDKATATVRKINDSLDRVARPFKEVGKSFKSLGTELGFDKIGKNLGTIRASAAGAARGIASIAAPLSAVTGVSSVAGVVALANSWAKAGRSITYASQASGVGTRGLQEIEGAAQLVGVAGGEATAVLQSLGDTMQDALYGRNQQALMLFNRLGVGIKKTGEGAVDAEAQLKSLAGAIYRLKTPQQQNLVASQLGLTPLLPLLRQGPAAIDQLTAKARELGLVMDGSALRSATEFANNLETLEASGRGLRNELGNALIPAIKPLVTELSSWISKNRELISAKVGEWAKDFGQWLSSIDWKAIGKDITDLGNDIKGVVDWLGGWKNAAIVVAAVMNAQLIGSVISLGATLAKSGIAIAAYIGQLGAMEAAATAAGAANGAAGLSTAGALGRFGAYAAALGGGVYIGNKISDAMDGTVVGDKFSHYNTKALGGLLSFFGLKNNRFSEAAKYDGYDQKYNGVAATSGADAGTQARVVDFFTKKGWSREQAAGIAANLSSESSLNPRASGDSGNAYGLAQWHGDRQQAFRAWAGKDIRTSSIQDQLEFVNYELTKGNESAAGDRLRKATTAREAGAVVSAQYERPADIAGEAARRGALADQLASAPQGPYSSGAAKDGAVKVEVELKNAPAGTTATAKSSGNASAQPVRIGYSGVGATM